MELDTYLTHLREDLDRATSLADEPTRHTASRLLDAIEPALRMTLVQALADASAAITAQLVDATVEVHMDGREPKLVVQQLDSELRAPLLPTPTPAEAEADQGTSRITLRLPETVKSGADAAAQNAGLSLNSWIVRACRQALSENPPPHHRTARRVTGWA